MALSAGVVTNGTTLRVGNGASPEVFTAVAEMTDINQPSAVAGEIEFTHLLSTAKEFKPGLSDFGSSDITFNVVVGNSLQQQLESDVAAGTIRNYRIIYADTVNGVGGAAFVKAFKRLPIAIDKPLQAVATLRATGAWVRVP